MENVALFICMSCCIVLIGGFCLLFFLILSVFVRLNKISKEINSILDESGINNKTRSAKWNTH